MSASSYPLAWDGGLAGAVLAEGGGALWDSLGAALLGGAALLEGAFGDALGVAFGEPVVLPPQAARAKIITSASAIASIFFIFSSFKTP